MTSSDGQSHDLFRQNPCGFASSKILKRSIEAQSQCAAAALGGNVRRSVSPKLPAGSLHPGKGAHSSPGAAAGGGPRLRGAAGHAHGLGSRVHR